MRAIIIANGPSLTLCDVEKCKGQGFVIAVNDAYKIAPWADMLYACDGTWWDYHLPKINGFKDRMWTANKDAARQYGLRFAQIDGDAVWSVDPSYIASGGNSGFQAMNLAFLWGYKEIILLGFDYGLGPAQKQHWFGNHPEPIRKAIPYGDWVSRIHAAAAQIKASGAKVINCSRQTAIECFERKALEDVFCPAS